MRNVSRFWIRALLLLMPFVVVLEAQISYAGPVCHGFDSPQCSVSDVSAISANPKTFQQLQELATIRGTGDVAAGTAYFKDRAAQAGPPISQISTSCLRCHTDTGTCGLVGCTAPCVREPGGTNCMVCGWLACAGPHLCGVPASTLGVGVTRNGTPATYLLSYRPVVQCGSTVGNYSTWQGWTNSTNSTNSSISSSPLDLSGKIQKGIELWSIVFSAIVCVIGGGGLGIYARRKKLGARPIVASLTSLLVLILCSIGQGLVVFDVNYKILLTKGEFFSDDFWAGAAEMWKNRSKLLAISIVVFSGIWPMVKNAFVIVTVCGQFRPPLESLLLRLFAVCGRGAFMEIGMITVLVSVLNLEVGVDGDQYIVCSPRFGSIVILAGLVLSRVLTTCLVHVFPPASLKQLSYGALPVTGGMLSKHRYVLTLVCSILAPIFTCVGLATPVLKRRYSLSASITGGMAILGSGEDSWNMWSAVWSCISTDKAKGKVARIIFAITTLFFGNICGLLQSFLPLFAWCIARFIEKRAAWWLAHILQLACEWACLDVVALSLVVLSDQLDDLTSGMQESLAGQASSLDLVVEVQYGLWFCLSGGFLGLVAAQLVLKDCYGGGPF